MKLKLSAKKKEGENFKYKPDLLRAKRILFCLFAFTKLLEIIRMQEKDCIWKVGYELSVKEGINNGDEGKKILIREKNLS